jgi:hypothetical protein
MYWFGLSKPSLRSNNDSNPASNAIDSLGGLRQSCFFSDLLGFEHEGARVDWVLLFTCLLLILKQGLRPQTQGPQKANKPCQE